MATQNSPVTHRSVSGVMRPETIMEEPEKATEGGPLTLFNFFKKFSSAVEQNNGP